MTSKIRSSWRVLGVFVALLVGVLIAAPFAAADIIEVEQAASCATGGNLGGGLCAGINQPFTLSALLALLSAPNSIFLGTQKYVVTNDIGNTFSFTLTSTGQNNTGVADNGQCQINGGATAFFSGCSIVDAASHTTFLGGTQINSLTFPVTITFTGSAGLGATFTLGFVSMQGTSSTTPVPEPATLALFGTGLLGIAALKRRLQSRRG